MTYKLAPFVQLSYTHVFSCVWVLSVFIHNILILLQSLILVCSLGTLYCTDP